jgi:hypothetical protein
VVIGNFDPSHPLSAVTLDGVLFNHGPRSAEVSSALVFKNAQVDLEGPFGGSGRTKFANYAYSAVLFDEICQGRFGNFNFTDQQVSGESPGIGWIDQVYSAVHIDHVRFDAVTADPQDPNEPYWYWKVLLSGTGSGMEHWISDCEFRGHINPKPYHTPLYLINLPLRMHHGVFPEGSAHAISMGGAALDLSRGARNAFSRVEHDDYLDPPFIQGLASQVDLYCGHNAFLHEWIFHEDSDFSLFVDAGCTSSNWSRNFWGRSCEIPLADPSDYLPACASDGNPLAVCADDTSLDPCDDRQSESALVELGHDADRIGNHAAAAAYWCELLETLPGSKHGVELTGRVKGLGVTTPFGAEHYGHLRQRLETAALAADSLDPGLSLLQRCGALCVEGRHGDRALALDGLDSLAAQQAAGSEGLKTIALARIEIEGYPPQGGISALHAPALAARAAARVQGARALGLALVPSELQAAAAPAAESRAARPAGPRLSACWPNPFNPLTRVDLQLEDPGPVRLEVFNLRGQRVRTLHEGPLAAGIHRFEFEAGDLASGLYFIRARQGGRAATAKALLAK